MIDSASPLPCRKAVKEGGALKGKIKAFGAAALGGDEPGEAVLPFTLGRAEEEVLSLRDRMGDLFQGDGLLHLPENGIGTFAGQRFQAQGGPLILDTAQFAPLRLCGGDGVGRHVDKLLDRGAEEGGERLDRLTALADLLGGHIGDGEDQAHMAADPLLAHVVQAGDLSGMGDVQASTGDGVHPIHGDEADAVPRHLDGPAQAERLGRGTVMGRAVDRVVLQDALVDQILDSVGDVRRDLICCALDHHDALPEVDADRGDGELLVEDPACHVLGGVQAHEVMATSPVEDDLHLVTDGEGGVLDVVEDRPILGLGGIEERRVPDGAPVTPLSSPFGVADRLVEHHPVAADLRHGRRQLSAVRLLVVHHSCFISLSPIVRRSSTNAVGDSG